MSKSLHEYVVCIVPKAVESDKVVRGAFVDIFAKSSLTMSTRRSSCRCRSPCVVFCSVVFETLLIKERALARPQDGKMEKRTLSCSHLSPSALQVRKPCQHQLFNPLGDLKCVRAHLEHETFFGSELHIPNTIRSRNIQNRD